MNDDDSVPHRRSRRVRSAGRAAYSGTSVSDASSAEGYSTSEELNDDVLSDGLDDDLADIQPVTTEEVLESRVDPASRLRDVGRRGGTVEREYRLQLLHRALMRRVPVDQIAAQFGVSISQVYKDRSELKRRLQKEAEKLDTNSLIGDAIGFYGEVSAMALRMASANDAPKNIKLASLRTALAAKNDMHRMFQASGVFDVLRYKGALSKGDESDMQRMVHMTEAMLDMLDGDGSALLEDSTPAFDFNDMMTQDDDEEITVALNL